MSGTFPTTVPYYSSIDIKSVQSATVSRSASGRRQSRKTTGHIWEMKVSFPTMTRAEFSEIDAFIMSQDGEYGSFDIAYTLDNQGTWVDDPNPLVKGATAKGSTSILIDGLTSGKTIVAGDIFKVGGNKVYKAVTGGTVGGDALLIDGATDALLIDGTVSDKLLIASTGEAFINFRPPLIEDIADNQAVTHTSVNFHVAIMGVHEYEIRPPELYRYELDLEEVF